MNTEVSKPINLIIIILKPAQMNHFLNHFKIAPAPPTLDHLMRLSTAFSNLPYENATKIIKKATTHGPLINCFRLPDEVWRDYLLWGTGGTCFSLTWFLHQICKHQNFVSYIVMANRSYGANTHCALVVCLGEKRFLVDPGFLIQTPVELCSQGSTVQTGFNELNISPVTADDYEVATITSKIKKQRYTFKDVPTSWEEFSRHWSASFDWPGLKSLFVTTVLNDQQIYIHDDHLRFVKKDSIEKHHMNAKILEEVGDIIRMDKAILERARQIILTSLQFN